MLCCCIAPNSKAASTASACASEPAQTPCTIIARIKFLAKVEAADTQLHVGPFKEYLGDFRRPNELYSVSICTSIDLVKSLLAAKVLTAEIPLAPVGRGVGLRLSHTSAFVALVSSPNLLEATRFVWTRRSRVHTAIARWSRSNWDYDGWEAAFVDWKLSLPTQFSTTL